MERFHIKMSKDWFLDTEDFYNRIILRERCTRAAVNLTHLLPTEVTDEKKKLLLEMIWSRDEGNLIMAEEIIMNTLSNNGARVNGLFREFPGSTPTGEEILEDPSVH